MVLFYFLFLLYFYLILLFYFSVFIISNLYTLLIHLVTDKCYGNHLHHYYLSNFFLEKRKLITLHKALAIYCSKNITIYLK